jgi:hypothetical protein
VDGGGALGFALKYALGADKSERQNRHVRVGNRVSISDPACTGLSGSTKAVCVVIGTNSHLFASTTLDGVNWTAFTDLDLGGTLIFNPTCMDIGDMIGFCGAVTTDGELRLIRFQAGSGPVSWENTNIITFPPITLHTLGNARLVTGGISIPSTIRITSDPSCTAGLRAAVACGVRGSDSALYVSQFNGTTFSPFQFQGGTLAGAPSCAFAICAARGPNSELFSRRVAAILSVVSADALNSRS